MNDEFNLWRDESSHAKILKQFNTPKSQGGYNCDGFEEYPKLLYKASRHPISRRYYVALAEDELSLDRTRVLVDAQMFNRSCQLTVSGPEMEEKAIKDGWRKSQAEAIELVKDYELRDATLAAHRNYEDQGMSEKALAESEAYQRVTPGHVAEIPEQPRMRKPLTEEQLQNRRASLAKARAARGKKGQPVA